MLKQKGRVPRVAKLTLAGGTALVDVESGIFVGVTNDEAPARRGSRGNVVDVLRSQPRGRSSSKLPRN